MGLLPRNPAMPNENSCAFMFYGLAFEFTDFHRSTSLKATVLDDSRFFSALIFMILEICGNGNCLFSRVSLYL